MHGTRSDCLNSPQWITGIFNSPITFWIAVLLQHLYQGASDSSLFSSHALLFWQKRECKTTFKMHHHISSHIFPQVERSTSIQSFHVWKLRQNFDQPFCLPLHLSTLTYQFYHNILLQTFLVSPHLYYPEEKKGISTFCSKLFMNKMNCTGPSTDLHKTPLVIYCYENWSCTLPCFLFSNK